MMEDHVRALERAAVADPSDPQKAVLFVHALARLIGPSPMQMAFERARASTVRGRVREAFQHLDAYRRAKGDDVETQAEVAILKAQAVCSARDDRELRELAKQALAAVPRADVAEATGRRLEVAEDWIRLR